MPRFMPLTAPLLMFALACAGIAAVPENTPTLLHASLLNGVLLDANSGELHLGNIQAFNLPEPPNGGYSAQATEPAQKLWATLALAAGTEVARFAFGTERGDKGALVLSYNEITCPGQADHPMRIKIEPGDYILTFHLASGPFYSFPFTVKLVNGKSLLFGDWNTWGYFLYGRADPEQALIWKMWLRRHETGNKDEVETKIVITRDSDGKAVATSRVGTKHYLTDNWVRYDLDMMQPSTSVTGGGFLQAKELLKQDGAYTLKVTISGAPYGVWNFKVVGNKLAPAGRTDRATADPLAYIMGGSDAFWYGAEGPVQANAAAMAPAERTFTQKGFIPDCKAVVVNGTTLVMIAPVVTFLEAQSQWNAAAKTLAITHGDKTLKLTVGQATAQGSGGPVALGVAPQQREGEFYAPLKPVAQALGAEVQWEAQLKQLIVIDGDRAGLIHVP